MDGFPIPSATVLRHDVGLVTQDPEAKLIMKNSILHPTHPIAAIAICAVASMNLQAKEIQVGRYSLLAATPTEAQAELLAATITVQFPNRIQTVGESVRYLLQRSGYRLATAESTGPNLPGRTRSSCLRYHFRPSIEVWDR